MTTFLSENETVIKIVIALALLLAAVVLYVRRNSPEREPSGHMPRPSASRMPFTRLDAYLILAFCAVYGMVAFRDLGSMKTPSTEYRIAAGESLVFDFGEDPQLLVMNWYLRDVDYITFTVETRGSEEEEWSQEEGTTMGKGFYWSSYTLGSSGRYLRLTNHSADVAIAELVFQDENGGIVVPVNSTSMEALFDETELFPEELDYRSSTYFDEYLYARTAYAFLNGTEAAEITHPPMGKILMAVGVALFGASPFGFRFMGTLLGVLMLPFMYVLGRDMTKSRVLGAFACFLLACDFMHFVQTRMATIDVFITFFTLLMFYFMYQYSRMSFYDTQLYRTFLPLGACGVSFGMGVACKWTGFYAGLGLAILFFRVLYLRAREYGYARKMQESADNGDAQKVREDAGNGDVRKMQESAGNGDVRKMRESAGNGDVRKMQESAGHGISCETVTGSFRKNMLGTLAFSAVFFLVIPFLIYLLSYIPFSDGTGAGLLERMINNQRYMLRYHVTLTGEHTFASAWYTWPLMLKTVLYYSEIIDQTLRQGISGIGNPLIWWAGIPAFFCLIILCVRSRVNIKKRGGSASGLSLEGERHLAESAGFLLVAYLSCYLPWCLVSRTTFIYHYFPCVPLVVCMITVSLALWKERMSGKKFAALLLIYSAAALGLFVLFYPVLSGRTVSKEYVETFLEWLDGWMLVQ